MSAEEFIYNVIGADNVAQLDLNVIANTLANTDSLIRQIKAQNVENESLKEKITSLRSSALQIKQLYEAEVGKNRSTVSREEDYIRRLKELEARERAAENARVNAELREKETVAELERRLAESKEKYDGLAVDMLRSSALLAENSLLSGKQHARLRDLKSYVQGLAQSGAAIPEDAIAIMNKRKTAKRKRKSLAESKDQATMTDSLFVSSVAVEANIPLLRVMVSSSTSTSDFTELAGPAPPTRPTRSVADKSTMYCSSTITRSTCTSAFIKRVDVAVNYPEVVPKSIDDILRECVVELPSLLSPILDEIPVCKASAQTQTEPYASQRPTTTCCGTNTELRNIRRKLDYVRKSDNSASSQVLSIIKKEESMAMASSAQSLPAAFQQSDDPTGVNPQLTQIWALLGETMFRLLGSGRMFDSQCYNTINERLAMINNLIDPESGRGTQMMSEVFAAASAAMVSGREASPRKIGVVVEPSPIRLEPPGKPTTCQDKDACDYEERAAGSENSGDEALANGSDEQSQPEMPVGLPQIAQSAVTEPDDASCEAEQTTLETEADISRQPAETDANGRTSPESTKEINEEGTQTDCLLIEELISSDVVVQHDEKTDDCSETPEALVTADEIAPLEEHDEIADELRLMEADSDSALERMAPTTFQLPDFSELGEKHYLHVPHDEESMSTDDECDRMMIAENNSPPKRQSTCQSIGSNGTLISPIKVRETNELVKEQFKTPTSPAISKRKLRDRLEVGAAKRGRLSPTTEALLGDDWDLKFSHIKDYFTLPSSLNPIEEGKRNPDYQEDDKFDDISLASSDFVMPQVQFMQALPERPRDPPQSNEPAPLSDISEPLHINIAETITQTAVSDSPESPPLEDSPESPSLEDSPQSPLAEDSPQSPPLEDSPQSPTIEDSPQSPPMEDSAPSVFAVSEQFESPASPAPPDSQDSGDAVEPKIIPSENTITSRLSQAYGNTPIGKTVDMYSNSRRAEVLRNMSGDMSKTEAALKRRLVAATRAYMNQEWTVENLQLRCADMLATTTDTRMISLAIIECAVSYDNFELDAQCSPPAPTLPRTTQQLVLLVKTLNDTLFTLDKVILHELDRKVFTLKADKVKLETITALTYLYIGIADSSRLYGCTARLYIYKCLYYFNFKGLPLIYTILRAFPHALPKKTSQYFDNSDAMVSTIRTILMNMNFTSRGSANQDAALYKKSELLKLLKCFYGYQQGSPTYEELITNLVEKIKANKLKNVDYCLIVVAKRKGYEWAKDHIVQKQLYPLLNDYLKQMGTDASTDDRICCLIFTISAILKTQPNSQDVSKFMQMFGSIVEMSDGNRRVQEAAVAGLVRFTRFGFAEVYEWLCKWCPSYEVTGRIKLMLATFIHRKESHFWKQLSQREIV